MTRRADMFGKKFDLPPLPPELVDTVKAAMLLAEQQFSGTEGVKKKEFVKNRVKDASKKLDLKALPSWLEEPIREAVVVVIIEVVWNLLFKGKKASV
jgi:hypothetical protein